MKTMSRESRAHIVYQMSYFNSKYYINVILEKGKKKPKSFH